MTHVFDDDFKLDVTNSADQTAKPPIPPQSESAAQSIEQQKLAKTMASLNVADGSIRVERLSRRRSTCAGAETPLYNSAYDRTVALPTQPDDHISNYLEPVDLNIAGSWAHKHQQAAACGVGAATAAATTTTSGATTATGSLDPNEEERRESDLVEWHAYALSDSSVRSASKLMRQRQRQAQQLVASGQRASAAIAAAATSPSSTSPLASSSSPLGFARRRKRKDKATSKKRLAGGGQRRRGSDSQCSIM